MHFLLLFVAVTIIAACSVQPKGSERVFYQTSSPRWLAASDIGGAKAEKGIGYLMMPSDAQPPYPSVIMLHTSLGVGSLEKDFAEILLQRDYAVLLIDSFTPRGLDRISDDQMVVSEASILADLYAGYEFLRNEDSIAPDNISVVGFSKGALPSLYSSFSDVYSRYGYNNDPFRSHLSFYPWCGLNLSDWAMGGPVQIHSGGEDVITPAALCEGLVSSVKQQYPNAVAEFFEYPGQRHAFTHPSIGRLKLPVGYPYPKNCRIQEQADGAFIEKSSGRTITAENLSEIIKLCSVKGAWVSGSEDARVLAYDRALRFLTENTK